MTKRATSSATVLQAGLEPGVRKVMSSLWAVTRTAACAVEHCIPQHGHDWGQSSMTLVVRESSPITEQ